MSTTPQQHVFPPKPKGPIRTPLTPVGMASTPKVKRNPLTPKIEPEPEKPNT